MESTTAHRRRYRLRETHKCRAAKNDTHTHTHAQAVPAPRSTRGREADEPIEDTDWDARTRGRSSPQRSDQPTTHTHTTTQGRRRALLQRSTHTFARVRGGKTGNDPSAGSPTETLLRLLLPLNDKVWTASRGIAAGEPAALPQSGGLTGSFNR